MPIPRLLNAFRDELTQAGIVRKPGDAGAAPPLWLEPWFLVPAPGQLPPEGNTTQIGQDAVLAAFLISGVAPLPLFSWSRYPFIEVRIRTAPNKAYIAEDIELAMTKQLIDRRDFMLGGSLHIIECEQQIALQRLGSDSTGYEHTTTYWFQQLRP